MVTYLTDESLCCGSGSLRLSIANLGNCLSKDTIYEKSGNDRQNCRAHSELNDCSPDIKRLNLNFPREEV